jgi:hypothetical protein
MGMTPRQDTSTQRTIKKPTPCLAFQRKMLSSSQACEYLGITLRELKGLRQFRKIGFYRIGHRTVTYDLADLESFLQARYIPSATNIHDPVPR